MRFIHIADCHIGAWREEKMRMLGVQAFQQAIQKAINEDADFVIIAGDLFHTALPSLDLVKQVVSALKKLKDQDIPMYFVPGSHDYSPSGKTILDVIEEAGLGKNVARGRVEDEKLCLKFTVDNTIKTAIIKALQELGFPESQISLEHPAVEEHGDYSSNVALATFEKAKGRKPKAEGKTPRELAGKIVEILQSNEELKKIVSRIEVAGPGFINFYLTKSVLVDELKRIEREKLDFGKRDFLQRYLTA